MAEDQDSSREGPGTPQENLDRDLVKLKKISEDLSRETSLIAVATAFNTGLAALVAAGAEVIKTHALGGILAPTLGFVLFLPLAWVTYTLWKFDRMYRIGYQIMQEVSDAVEYTSRVNRKNFKVRITFQNFLASSALPFYRGTSRKDNYATIIYLVANISMFMFAVILLVISARPNAP